METVFPDKNVTKKDFNFAGKNLLVSDIFATVQGEGPFAGHRAIFLRLAGCNLGGKAINGPGCDFCDTDFRMDRAKQYKIEDLADDIELLSEDYFGISTQKLLVITGGEPFLQQANLASLLDRLFEMNWTVQIETNGTVNPIAYMSREADNEFLFIVVSQKIPVPVGGFSDISKAKYPNLSESMFDTAYCLKYVVNADPNNPYHYLPKQAYNFRDEGNPVYVSPMNEYTREPREDEVPTVWNSDILDQEKCRQNHNYAMQLAMKYDFIVNVQMHLFGQVK